MNTERKTTWYSRLNLDKIWLLIGLGIVVRLVFLGLMELLPEEAYYWNYSRHLDIGYLDHPPMVGWLIYLSEAILGKSELAVRLPAFLGWFLLAWAMYRLAEHLFGRGVGKLVVLLLAVLPIYMSVGFLMTPDAPFYAAWAGCLFFLERALLGGRSSAWIGAGVCFGLGLLSKYTMGLLVPTFVVYVMLDWKSRFWLRRPQPYLAVVTGAVLFLPVVYWNYINDWVSFAFQGSRRWSGGIDFHLHLLIGSVLILITPIGAGAAVRAIRDCWKRRFKVDAHGPGDTRRQLFMLTFTLVPLLVFVIHSLQGQPKLNWTGPVWLALLPMIALRVRRQELKGSKRHVLSLSRVWAWTAVVLLVFYAASFTYLAVGMPGVPAAKGLPFPIAWKEFGDRVEEIETNLETETASEPIIVGLDKYWIASEASFYDYDEKEDEVLPEFASGGLFGGNGLMWNRWIPPGTVRGRNALLVGFTPERLQGGWISRHFTKLTGISKEILRNRNEEVGRFYWRVGYDYKY